MYRFAVLLLLSLSTNFARAQDCRPLPEALKAPSGYALKRTFNMGFTTFPHSAGLECGDPSETNFHYIKNFGDLMVIAEDGTIPWELALQRWFNPALTSFPDQYPERYKAELRAQAARRARLPTTHKVAIYLNYMDLTKTRIADNLSYDSVTGARVVTPLPADLRYQFNNDYFVYAYLAHLLYMIEIYKPDYIGIGTENNILLRQIFDTAATPDPSDDIPYQAWVDFSNGIKRVHSYLKQAYPHKKIYFSLTVDDYNSQRVYDFGSSQAAFNVLLQAIQATQSQYLYTRYISAQTWQRENLKLAVDATDVIAVSAYPYMIYGAKVASIPADYLTRIREIAPLKPFAIAETGYLAEPLVFPDPLPPGAALQVYADGTPLGQYQYVSRIFADSQKHKALFINWYVARDYDNMWEQILKGMPNALLNRLWRDVGLFDGSGAQRWGMILWQTQLWSGVQR